MCGIAGAYDIEGTRSGAQMVDSMVAMLRHRGPDDAGTLGDDKCSIGAARLKIIDLSNSANQPFEDAGRRYILAYNGEIYNYVELREELRAKGVVFRTDSDTEVLLAAFLTWGKDSLRRLNGMFAFAIYDRETQGLFICVDRFGIKPVYLVQQKHRLLFASELKALIPLIESPAEADPDSVFDFLAYGATAYSERSFVKGITRLTPGQWLELRDGKVNIERWWSLSHAEGVPPTGRAEAAGVIRDLIRDSVRLRLRSDVPVGSCLSGGIDSSAIASIAAQFRDPQDPIELFTVSFPGEPIDEASWSELVRKRSGGKRHLVTPSTDDFLRDAATFVYYLDEPVASPSPFAQWCVMREAAKERITVLLDGQGSDEVFAGYHYFFGFLFYGLLRRRKLATLCKEIVRYLVRHHSIYPLTVMAYLISPAWIEPRRLLLQKWLDRDFAKKHASSSTYAASVLRATSLKDSLRRHQEIRMHHLLQWEDRNSCAFSLEARVPFLDHRLVEYIWRLPEEWLIRDGTTKQILREALQGEIPEAIRTRQDKLGFEVPESGWLREPAVAGWARSTLDSPQFKSRPYFNHGEVRRLFEEHFSGRKDHSKNLWRILFLEMWLSVFIDPGGLRSIKLLQVRPPLTTLAAVTADAAFGARRNMIESPSPISLLAAATANSSGDVRHIGAKMVVFLGLFDVSVENWLRPLTGSPLVGHVLVARNDPGPKIPKVDYSTRMGWPRGRVLAPIGRFLKVAQRARKEKPAMVISFLLLPHGLMGLLLARLRGVPHVSVGIAGRNELSKFRKGPLGRLVHSLLLRTLLMSEGIVVLGQDTRNYLISQGYDKNRIHIVPLTIDLERFRPSSEPADFDLITVARLEPVKRIELLLDAVKILKDGGVVARTAIVGGGSLESEMRLRAAALGIDDIVKFFGHQEETWKLYPRGRIFAMTSSSEGGPYTVIEARACGLPVVATDTGNVRDYCRDGIDSVIVPLDVTAQGFAEVLRGLLTDDGLTRKLAGRAREGAEKSSEGVAISGWEGLLRALEGEAKH